MAYTNEQWNKAKYLWELDKPLSYIVEKTGISKAQISKKSNKEQWKKETEGNSIKPLVMGYEEKKETLEEEKETIVSKLATLEDYKITLLNEIIEEERGKKSLLFSTANLAVIRANQMLTKNTKTIMSRVDLYEDGKKIATEYQEKEVPLSMNDYKESIELTDKASVTLGINQRHSNSQVTVNTQNNQNIELNKEVVTQTLESFENEY